MDDTAQANQQQPIPTPPVATPSKEHAPVVNTEFVKPAPHEARPEIAPEVARHVEVSVNPEQPKIGDEHKKLGLHESGEATPAPSALSDDSVFPLTKTQVDDSQSKTYSIWDSFRWFGAKVGRQMLRAHKKLFK